jgi:hypothetical protein
MGIGIRNLVFWLCIFKLVFGLNQRLILDLESPIPGILRDITKGI